MSLDAGQVTAEATLDLSQFDAAMARLVGNVNQLNAALGTIKPAKPTLDTTQVEAAQQRTSAGVADLAAKLLGLPKAKVDIDVGSAEQNVGALNKALQGLLGSVGVNVGALGGLTTVLGAGGVVAAAGAATVALAQLGAEFKALNRAIENTTGASGDTLHQLRQDFDTLFRTVPADGGDLVKALAKVHQELGVTGPALTGMVADINAFTRVTGGDLVTNTRGIVDVFNAWGISAAEAHQTISDLVRGMQVTGSTADELFAELSRGAASFQALGLNLKESIVLLDALKDAGLPARAVFSSLREAMNTAAKSGADTATFFQDVITVLKSIDDDATAAAKAGEIFGDAFGPTLARLIRQGRLDVDQMVARIDGMGNALEGSFARGGTAQAQFQIALNNLKKDLEPAGQAVLTFAANLGLTLVGQINTARQAIEDFMNSGAVQAFLALQRAQQNIPGGFAEKAIGASPVGQVVTAARQLGVAGQPPAATAADSTTAALNEQTQATADLSQAQTGAEKTTRSLEDAQRNFELATKKAQEAAKSLADQLREAGGNTELIATLLAAEQQTTTLDQAVRNLADRGLAATIQAMRNQAEVVGQATGDWAQWDAVVQLATDHLAAQATTQDENTRAQREAEAAVKAVEDAMAKAATVAQDQYGKRLQDLATAVMPQLDAATAVSLQQALLLGQQDEALGLIAQATGRDIDALTTALRGSGAGFDVAAKQAAALAKGLAGFTADEQRQRAESLLSTLSGGFDLATRANLRFIQETQGADAALVALAQQGGLNLDQLRAAITGTTEDLGRFTAAAQAAQTFQQTGRIVPAAPEPPDAGKQFQEAVKQAQEALRASLKDLADQLAEAGRQLADARAQIQRELQNARLEFFKAQADIARQQAEAEQQLRARLADIQKNLNATLDDINKARIKAIADHEKAIADSQKRLTETLKQANEQYQQQSEDLSKRAAEAAQQAVASQRSALESLSSSLASLRQQELQAQFQQATQLQDIAQRRLAGGTQAEQSQLATELTRLQGQAGLEAAGRQQQEQAARRQFSEAVQAATEGLSKALAAISQEQAAAQEQLAKVIQEANAEAQRSRDEVDKALRDALKQLADREGEALTRANEERERAKEEARRRREELEKLKREAEERLQQAQEKADDQLAKADQEFAKRQEDLRKQQEAAEQRFIKETAGARKEMARAIEQLQGVLGQNNELLKSALARMGIKADFNYTNATFQETGADLLRVSSDTIRQRLRAGIGGG